MDAMDALSDFYDIAGTGKGVSRDVLQQLQSITASVMYIPHNKLINQNIFKQILPQKDPKHRRNWIIGCFNRRLNSIKKNQRCCVKIIAMNVQRMARMYTLYNYICSEQFVLNNNTKTQN